MVLSPWWTGRTSSGRVPSGAPAGKSCGGSVSFPLLSAVAAPPDAAGDEDRFLQHCEKIVRGKGSRGRGGE